MAVNLKMCSGLAALSLWAAPVLADAPIDRSLQARPDIVGPVLIVTDLERSLRFYVEGLGLALFRRLPPGPGPGAVLVSATNAPPPHILIRQAAALPGKAGSLVLGNGLSRIMLAVPDSAAVAERLRAAGYAPSALNPAKIFFVADPDGYRYEVIQIAQRK